MAREYEDAVLFGAVHQMTVDAYAAQHARGQPAKSLSAHLVSLHTMLVCGRDPTAGREAILRFVEGRKTFPSFDPLPQSGPMTILDVARAGTRAEDIDAVRRWAAQVWEAWAPHHDAIRRLAEHPPA